MKKTFTLLLFCLNAYLLSAQYGQDVKITPTDTMEHTQVKIDVAFNGWLYAAHSTWYPTGSKGGITIRKSTDNGLTWTTMDKYNAPNLEYPRFDIVVAGNDTNSLTLYLVGINHNLTSGNYTLYVDRYNATNGVFLGSALNYSTGTRKIYDVAIATDYRLPAVGASPYSIGVLYSCYSPSLDSLNFYCSVDGGSTFLPSQNVAGTGYYMGKISLAYGRSASGSNGRYFFAWERKASSTASTGNIFTSRNTSTVNGGFIPPLCLDSLSNTMIGLCRNPSIAVQYNSIDNDSGAVTAIVTCDRDYSNNGTDYDILGFCNKKAHFTNYWFRFDVINSGENDMQSNAMYNPATDSFHVTFLDSTNLNLRHVCNTMNMTNPSSWGVKMVNYANNPAGLGASFPKVAFNPANNKQAFAWVKNDGGKGVSYFDADYSTIQVTTTFLADSICQGDSVFFGGAMRYAGGVYSSDTVQGQNGVDSTTQLNLVVHSLPAPVVVNTNNTLSTGAYNAYQWIFNGTDITGANAPIHVAASSGDYSVRVTDGNGCINTSADLAVTVVSVEDVQGELQIRVYPNPVADVIYIDAEDVTQSYVRIYSVDGKLIEGVKYLSTNRIDVSSLQPGLYLAEIKAEGKTHRVNWVKL